jgi:LuxR family maltose regulon positive regulatory protein
MVERMESLPQGTVTLLFTDIEGSTRLLERLGRDRYGPLLEQQRELLRDAIEAGGGAEVDATGDSLLAVFSSAGGAVAAAAAGQRALAAGRWPADAEVRVRIGLHTGEASLGRDGYVGIAVHRGRRVCEAAHGGQILVSSATHAIIAADPPDGIGFREVGEVRLAGFEQPERLFQVVAKELPEAFAEPRAARPWRDGQSAVTSPGPVLVATKLHVPDVRPGFVSRAELVARLVAGGEGKLALLCAPAGWGKTILLSEWSASPDESRPFAWVSLDPADDDPVRFWSYLIGALRTVVPALGDEALARLPSAGRSLVEVVLPPLINELAGLSQRSVLVLDDYDLVHNELIHTSVSYLLRRLPRTLQLAIASRADPALALAGLRASGEVTEIRAEELRFSDAEADALLNGSLDLGLERSDLELLQARTEGWAAGLQLAGLSLQAQADKHAFLEAFAGHDRQIGEYLQELLAEQPAALRAFLLHTSILERLCAPLCDAVTGGDDASSRLEEIQRSNLFLVPLDSRGQWYRYHHLFRDLLRNELARSKRSLLPELHRRAAAWHKGQGSVDETIAHATSAGDFAEAAELIAENWRWYVIELGQGETVARWLDRLPSEAVLADARLCFVRAWIALISGRQHEVEEWLRAAEASPPPAGAPQTVFSSLDSGIAQLRAIQAVQSGDVQRAIEAGRRSLELEPDTASQGYAVASIVLGTSFYFAGELSKAEAALTAGLRGLEGNPVRAALFPGLGYRALIHADEGQLALAESLSAEADQLIDSGRLGEDVWATPAFLAKGRLLELRGEFAVAESAYAHASILARRGGRRHDLTLALISLARLKRRAGDRAGARSLARKAREVLATCPDPGILSELLARTERSLQLASAPASAPVLAADLELSERELTLLRLLASELSQREIGSELFISVNTVKGHVRSIFRKLGVNTRADAVARGGELGLL